MALGRWKRLSRELKYKNPWWDYFFERFELPSGKEGEYHYVHTTNSVIVVPVTAERKIHLVNQYRYLHDIESIELPMGGIDSDDEAPEAAALRELIEETGHTGELEPAGHFEPMTGISDETCYVFIARNLRENEDHQKDHMEEFEHLHVTPNELDELIMTNKITCGMTMAAWLLVKDKI